MPDTTYSDLLKHPNWQKKRLCVLNNADWTCVVCADTDSTLHVHHRYYLRGRKPWEYPDDAFMALCSGCHEEITAKAAEIRGAVGLLHSHDLDYLVATTRCLATKSESDTILIENIDQCIAVAVFYGIPVGSLEEHTGSDKRISSGTLSRLCSEYSKYE